MACTIKTSKLITVNGGTKAFGGVVSNVTMNLGAGNQSTTASVSLVRDGNSGFDLPETFEEVTVGVGNAKYKMVVRSYSTQTSATSADSLKIELVDTSYQWLDLNVIILNEADRTGGGIERSSYGNGVMAVHALGTKWIPRTDEDMFGNILPTPDGQWMKAREYWTNKNWKAMFGLGVMKPMTPQQLEDRIVNESGSILYEAGEVFELIGIPSSAIPGTVDLKEKLKFVGTFREVLTSLANYYGFFCWWDSAEEKLRLSTEIDLDEGGAILDNLEDSCVVTASGSTTDASSTYAKAAFSQFDNRWTYTATYGSSPARGIRFHRAELLDSVFKYRKCWEGENVKAPNLEEFGAPFAPPNVPAVRFTINEKKAMMAALMGPDIYAAYVLQTLAAANDGVVMPNMDWEEELPNGEKISIVADGVPAANIVNECPWQQQDQNDFLLDLYSNQAVADCGKGEHPTCGCIWPANVKGEALKTAWRTEFNRLSEINEPAALRNLGFEKVGKPPKLDMEQMAGFFRINGTGSTLFKGGNSEPNAEDDPMYKYLRALVPFVNRFYVVRRGGNLSAIEKYWVSEAGIKKTYNYFVGTSSQPELSNASGTLTPVHPALRLDKCQFPEFLELFKALEYIYTGKDSQLDPDLYPAILDFTRWLDGAPATLAAYFAAAANGGGVNQFFSCTPQTSVEGANQPKMYFVVLQNATNMDPHIDADIKLAADAINLVGGGVDINVQQFLDHNNCSLYMANNNDIHRSIPPLTDSDLRVDAERWLQCEYATTSANGNDTTSTEMPYNFYCNWLALPNLSPNDKVFTGKFESTQVSAEELGLSNGEFTTFGSIIASPFSPTNKLAMAEVNRVKAETATDYDTVPAVSRRVSFILTEEDEVDLPLQNEGLEGLSINVNADHATVDLIVGNVAAKKVAKDIATNKLNTAFNSYASQAFSSAEIMFSNRLKFFGIG